MDVFSLAQARKFQRWPKTERGRTERRKGPLLFPLKQFDLIIVGGGIAGTTLAMQSLNLGLKPLLIDKHNPNSASRRAAGVINPITGRSMNKSWMIDDLLPFTDGFYPDLEIKLGTKFFHEIETFRYLPDTKAENDWSAKQGTPGINSYLSSDELFKAPRGFKEGKYFKINGGRILNVHEYLRSCHSFLKSMDSLLNIEFSPNDLKRDSQFIIGDQSSPNLILAEGASNGFDEFNYLPLIPNRGQMRLLSIPGLGLDHITHISGLNLTPFFEKDLYYLGSTYERNETEAIPTSTGDVKLNQRFQDYFELDFEVVLRAAGIRPTVIDRKPLLGAHPGIDRLYIFNGMGSKGVSLAPFFSIQLINHILNGTELNPEVDIARFKGKYEL